MGEVYNIWEIFWNNIPIIKMKIESIARLCGLSSEEALIRLVVNRYPDTVNLYEKNIFNRLCEMGLCEYTEKGIDITNKGKIIIKSLESALEKL